MLDFMCSFEGMDGSNYQGVFNTMPGNVTTVNPRTGTRAVQLHGFANAYVSGLSNAASRYVGVAYSTPSVSTNDYTLIALSDGGNPTTAGNCQVSLQIKSDGAIAVYRGRAMQANSGGTLLGTSAANVIAANDLYYYIEFGATIHSSAGTIEVRVNGVAVLTLSSQNTQNTANAYANGFAVGGGIPFTYSTFDDLYCVSGSGGVQTTFLGPVRVVGVIASSGNGAATGWTPSTGTDRGAMVDDTTPDGDSTYNSSGTPGNIDTYDFAALGYTGTVLGLQVRNSVKTDSGVATVQSVQRIGGVNYLDTAQSPTLSYSYMPPVVNEVSPATAIAYTVSEIDGAQFGIKHTS